MASAAELCAGQLGSGVRPVAARSIGRTSSRKACDLAEERFQTTTFRPALIRHLTIPSPMMPSPMKPHGDADIPCDEKIEDCDL